MKKEELFLKNQPAYSDKTLYGWSAVQYLG